MSLLKPWLVLVAAPAEADAVVRGIGGQPDSRFNLPDWELAELSPAVHLARTGIGKVNAAVAAAKLADPVRYSAVVNLGICGALPRTDSPGGYLAPLASVILATKSLYADEGVATPSGFLTCEAVGFPLGGPPDHRAPQFAGDALLPDQPLFEFLRSAIGPEVITAPIATVSSCSGTDELALAVSRRTGATAEAMEGAAIAHALARLHGTGLPFCELRVVSNTTGDRTRQVWVMKPSLNRLADLAAAIANHRH